MKTFGKTLILATAAATLATAAPALAQGMGMGGGSNTVPPRFAAADTNNDGVISREEADAAHAERFKKADADGDGTVTAQEMQTARAAMRAEMMDRRGDMGGRHGGGYGRHGGGHGMKGMHGGGKLQGMMELMDTDGSGAVSQEELLARFKRLDANDDGAVTVAEARDGMRAAMRDARTGAGDTGEATE